MRRPAKLSDYPWVVVRIDCVLCDRRGCYRLARLAARYGPEQSLNGLLADLAHNCPWWRSNPRKYEPRCGARYVDLERNLPPPDDPQAPVYRQRQPDRESLRKPRARVGTSEWDKLPLLSGWQAETLTVCCRRCPRRDTFITRDLTAVHGAEIALGVLLKLLVADCPRAAETRIYEMCQAHFELPW